MKSYLSFLLLALFVSGTAQPQTTPDSGYTIYFNTNSYLPTKTAADQLQQWLAMQNGGEMVRIKGYTDESGSRRYNRKLSKRRANAIARLLRKSLQNSPLELTYFGEDSLASSTKQQLNRRVLIELVPPEKESRLPSAKVEDTSSYQTDTTKPGPVIIQNLKLEKIYFVPDKAIIEQESLPYLQDLANTLMRFAATARFEIRGHVNCYGVNCNGENNVRVLNQLSEDRAKEVYAHMVSLGVPAARMTYKGMGSREMVYPEPKTEVEMRKNMRVEVVVY